MMAGLYFCVFFTVFRVCGWLRSGVLWWWGLVVLGGCMVLSFGLLCVTSWCEVRRTGRKHLVVLSDEERTEMQFGRWRKEAEADMQVERQTEQKTFRPIVLLAMKRTKEVWH